MLTFTFVVLSLIALLWLGLLLSPIHRWGFRYPVGADTDLAALYPGAADPASDKDWPAVTVVVPARNEQAWLAKTVPTYCTQDYPNLRVVLVDDGSEDDSPRILEDLRRQYPNLTVLRAAERPAGWCGKPWAVTQGVEQAEGELLLFTDADCFFHPKAARQAVRLLLRGGFDVLSLFPQMTCGSAFERVGIGGLATVLAVVLPLKAANNPRSPVALAAGGFLLFRKDAYEKVGGHAAVKSHLVEDVTLAKKSKALGLKVHSRYTPDLVHTRMYEGAADLWEGLAKNAYAGMDYQPRKISVGLVIGVLAFVLPPAYFVVSLVAALRTHSRAAWAVFVLSAVIVACQTLVHARAVRHLRLPLWHALLMPAGAGLYCAIAAHSAYQHHFRGGNLWSGRRYDRKMLLTAVETPAGR